MSSSSNSNNSRTADSTANSNADSNKKKEWVLAMTAEPVISAWTSTSNCNSRGAELQDTILKGFAGASNAVWSSNHQEFEFVKEFTFKEHGEFFRGALTMAGIRYTGDFY